MGYNRAICQHVRMHEHALIGNHHPHHNYHHECKGFHRKGDEFKRGFRAVRVRCYTSSGHSHTGARCGKRAPA